MPALIIIGGGGQARVIIDLVRCLGGYEILGVLDDHATGSVAGFEDVRVLGKIDEVEHVVRDLDVHWEGEAPVEPYNSAYGDSIQFMTAFGDNVTRRQVVERLTAQHGELPFATLVHPSAVVATGVEIGAGTVIAAGAVIQPCTTIGGHCIVNTSASLDHDNMVNDFASVAPGVVTGGGVTLGEQSFVGIGSVIKHGTTIGRNAMIAAGSLVVKDVADDVIMLGSPAKVVRQRQRDERML